MRNLICGLLSLTSSTIANLEPEPTVTYNQSTSPHITGLKLRSVLLGHSQLNYTPSPNSLSPELLASLLWIALKDYSRILLTF